MTSTIDRLPLTEAAFQRAVITLATRLGWRVAHFGDSRKQVRGGRLVGDRQAAGWPDLVLCKPPRLIFAELKTEEGILSRGQLEWLDALTDCHAAVFVWRPSDWKQIQAILSRNHHQPQEAA